jgi:hypothetical protein
MWDKDILLKSIDVKDYGIRYLDFDYKKKSNDISQSEEQPEFVIKQLDNFFGGNTTNASQ